MGPVGPAQGAFIRMNPDLINGLLESIGAVLISLDVRRIHIDREVKGIYWPSRIFFLAWGCWNLYFYPYYDHFWSFVGGIFMTLVNVMWLASVVYYLRKTS